MSSSLGGVSRIGGSTKSKQAEDDAEQGWASVSVTWIGEAGEGELRMRSAINIPEVSCSYVHIDRIRILGS